MGMIMEKRECKTCKKNKHHYYSHSQPNGTKRFKDEDGHLWAGKNCWKCSLEKTRMYNLKTGKITTMDGVSFPRIKKGRTAERMVHSFFENLGFTSKITRQQGPDVTLVGGDGKETTIEVKSASKRKKSNCHTIDHLRDWQKKCDLIAIVFVEHKRIFIEPMGLHLSRCSPCGTRTVTNLLMGE